ncbi:MAG: ABC transporter substrate-binding protein [Candidatus Tectomicrobia bacterium]|uniref:ABC transporter substrate-binding protein n=1 Tax=Tectimicrobiota bacterium TaxID=2528274 RepID=A0A932M0V7_UNCTE|nr:ABC transporter substrate-binding protein [Candidatus Tectomicrobia bacterium]
MAGKRQGQVFFSVPAVLLFLGALVLGAYGDRSWAAPATRSAIKIGFMAPYVGVYAKPGKDMDNGFKLYLEEIKSQAGGRKIQLITEDTEAKPEIGPIKARKLVERDKVNILAGIIHSGVAYSIRDYVEANKIPLVITNAGAARLTAQDRSSYIFRVSFVNGQQDLAGGWYAYEKAGIRRVIAMAPDYSAGHEKAQGFLKTFKAAGGQVVAEIYPPLATQDFAPFLAQVTSKAGSTDAVWAFFAGSDSIRFIKQYAEYGLKDKVKLFVLGDTVDDSFLPSIGDAALGIANYLHYATTLDTSENKKFVAAYRQKYNEDPSMFSEQGYVGARVIAEAIKAVKGNVENREQFLEALRQVQFEAPRGPFKFDKFQNVIEPVYIRKVEKIGGKLQNVVTDKISDVDQFWTPKK